jgi:hypothetical protein
MQQLPEHLLLNSIYFSYGSQENFWSKPTGAKTESLVYEATYSLIQEVVKFPHTGKKVIQTADSFWQFKTLTK